MKPAVVVPWNGRINELPNNGVYTAQYGGTGNIVEILYLS